MNAQPKKTWIISDELVEAVERLIESGDADDFEHIVATGVFALTEEDDPELIEFMEKEVRPSLEKLDRDPGIGIPLDEAWARLQAHIAKRRGEG
jgi:hypothetical protein